MLLGRQGEGQGGGWGLAEDVLQQRYAAGVSHTEGTWRSLPCVPLKLESTATSNAGTQQAPRATASTSVPPQLEPWLLAAGAYAEEGAWQQAARSTRARMLFQYKPYSQQEPLGLEEEEVAAVVEAVFGRMGGGPPEQQDGAESLWGSLAGAQYGLAGAASTGEVAAVVLIKLLMDCYVTAGARAAFPLALLLLQRPLLAGEPAAQARVFDLLYNMSVHGELLYDTAADAVPEDTPALADAVAELDVGGDQAAAAANWKATVTSAFRATLAASMKAAAVNPRGSLDGRNLRSSLDGRTLRGSLDGRGSIGTRVSSCRGGAAAAEWPPLLGVRPVARCPRAERFQQWLRLLLFQLLGALAASGAASEAAWVAALSCLLHLTNHGGCLVRAHMEELPLPVVAALLEQSRRHLWSEHLHAFLTTLAANLLYTHSDADERGMQRSVKAASLADSLRSGGGGGGSGAGGAGSAAEGSGPDPAWWAACQLDAERLAAFGGVRHVLRCYREAPTAAARRNMFAVLLDHVLSGRKPAGQDAWAPALLQPAHSSETLALGAALLRMDAAEALHPLFLAGVSGTVQALADAVCIQMASLQAANPGRVVSVPPAMVGECLECLEEIATSEAQVPVALQEAVKCTLDAVASPDVTSPGSLAAPEAAAVWGCLADCMRDPSELGSRAGRGWLLQLLVAAAEHELAGGGTPQADGGAGPRGQATASPPPALLPEVSAGGGCRLQPGRRGMQGQHGLRELLIRALATTTDSRAADCFMAAVASLLAHVRLRCAAAGWEPEDGSAWSGSGLAKGNGSPPPSGATPGSSVRRADSAARLAAAPGSAGALPRLARAASKDSLADGDASAMKVELPDSASGSADSSPFDGQAGGWLALNCPEAIISTLSLAVEWLLQAPQEARQGAMLRAAQLLLAFTLTSPGQPAAGPDAGQSDRAPPATPGGSRPGTQHRLSVSTPAPLQLPASPGSSPAAGPGPLSPASLAQRASSPSLAALQAAAAAAAGRLRPATPRAGSFERLQAAAEGGATISAVDLAAAASGAGGGRGLDGGASLEGLEQRAAATGEAAATLLWSFLNGLAMVPQDLLRLVPPLLLRTLFDDLRPDSSSLQYDALAAAGAGASAARLTRAADEALGVRAAVQSDRPLWDARAAVLLLLMGRCAHDGGALRALGGASFFTALLREPDARLRHYAAVFVLRQLMLQQPLQYRRALRGVVARAQSANDEKLLSNPYLQLRAMLDQGRVQLDRL